MALIKSIAEIKALLPKFISNTTDPKVLPNFDQAEYKYLVPLTGTVLYNAIHAKYNDAAYPGNMSSDELSLLKKLQMVEACHAFVDEMALGQLLLTENGYKKVVNSTPVYRWEVEKLESTLVTMAADATEVLLNYLAEKKAVFTDWTSSDAYKSLDKLLIKSGTEFSALYPLFQPMRTFLSIKPKLEHVQDLYVSEAIGEPLLQYLAALATVPEGLQKSISLLKKAVAFLTIKESALHHSVRFSDSGFTVVGQRDTVDTASDAGRQAADLAMLQMKIDACERDGQNFLGMACYELVKWYKEVDAAVQYKTALDAGALKTYVDPGDRTNGNDTRKGVFAL
jgi:hypothetical protein